MIDRRWAIPVALILYGSITYYIGKNTGRFEEKDAQAKSKITQSDKHTDSVQIRTDTAKRQAAKLDSTHDIIRKSVKVVHDSVLVHDSVVVVSPEIAALIQSDDSLIAAQKHTLALQDTLIAAKNIGIGLRDQRIKLLESRGTQRFSKGFQVGVGMCQSQTRAPCIYAGYGFQLRIP